MSLAYSVQDKSPKNSLPRRPTPALFLISCAISVSLLVPATLAAAADPAVFIPQQEVQPQLKQSREPGPAIRIPRQQALNTTALDGVVRSAMSGGTSVAIPGAMLTLRNLENGQNFATVANGEGLFRIFPLPPGRYQLRIDASGYAPLTIDDLALQPTEVLSLEISLPPTGTAEIN